jgi:hypothetical protein
VLNPAAHLDTKPKSIQRPAKLLVSSEIRRADPNDKGARCAHKVDEPAERGFQCFDRMIAPSDHRYIVLAPREATGFCGECVREAAAVQFVPYIACCMACHEQAIELLCARKLDQTASKALAVQRSYAVAHGSIPFTPDRARALSQAVIG